jgi:hypothetical protein
MGEIDVIRTGSSVVNGPWGDGTMPAGTPADVVGADVVGAGAESTPTAVGDTPSPTGQSATVGVPAVPSEPSVVDPMPAQSPMPDPPATGTPLGTGDQPAAADVPPAAPADIETTPAEDTPTES